MLVADNFVLALVTLALLPATLVTCADHVLVALVAVAFFNSTDTAVADNLLVALSTLAVGEAAILAFADDQLVPVLAGVILDGTLVAVADNALSLAVATLAWILGRAVVTVAYNLLLVPLRRGANIDCLDNNLRRHGTCRTVCNGWGARSDCVNVSRSDHAGARARVTHVDAHCRASWYISALHALGRATAVLRGIAWASEVALGLVILLRLVGVDGAGTEAISVGKVRIYVLSHLQCTVRMQLTCR